MNAAITLLTNGLGMSLEGTVLLILLIASLVFFAADFRIGLIVSLLIDTMVFVWFYSTGLNWGRPLILMFGVLVLLMFTLYASGKTTAAGGVV